jgi:3-oxoacyl-(acyl-carrier-protein) synthase
MRQVRKGPSTRVSRRAGFPDSIGLVEAHGTSTPVGDKTELMVLDKTFRETGSPRLGGHRVGQVPDRTPQAAAGAAG